MGYKSMTAAYNLFMKEHIKKVKAQIQAPNNSCEGCVTVTDVQVNGRLWR